MNERFNRNAARGVVSRRGVLAASLAGGLALSHGAGRTLARQAATPAAAGALPPETAGWLKYNLNSATSEQFMGIPGAGERMTREFEEYRPYTSIGQFRGEMGKYIAPEEVALLEAYLFVPVDANAADADTMQQLPGVTADIAQALIAARPYASTDAFLAKLGESVAPELAGSAGAFLAPDAGATATWLRYNLNTATGEQFMGIPGAGERMTREFEEYRPYTTIGQFRGEMGKYIAPDEVAALEAYLFVPVTPSQTDLATLQQLPGVTAEVAQALVDGGPYDSVAAFQSALDSMISPELAAAAAAFLAEG